MLSPWFLRINDCPIQHIEIKRKMLRKAAELCKALANGIESTSMEPVTKDIRNDMIAKQGVVLLDAIGSRLH